MNIRTKEFNMSEAELHRVNKIAYYRPIKDLLISLASFTIIIVVGSIFDHQTVSIAIYCTIVLGYLLIYPFVFVNRSAKSQSKLHFKNRSCEITDIYLSTIFEDSSLCNIHFNNYIRITRESEWYFLYLSQGMFEYLPIRAFNSEDDINEFETIMKDKKLMQ